MNTAGKLVLAVIVVVALGVGVWYFAAPQGGTVTPTSTTTPAILGTQEFRDSDIGIAFRYPDTYILEEKDRSTGQRKHASIILARKEDLPPPQNGEGPPTIAIDAYQNNIDKYTIDQFIRATAFTNFKLSPDGVVATTTVNGFPAASFRWSGLYEGRTVVVARDMWVYAFSLTYLTLQDEIITDFDEILGSVDFDAI